MRWQVLLLASAVLACGPLSAQTHSRDDEAASDERLIDEIGSLRKEAVRAKREGQVERARELWSRADRLDRELRGRMDGRRDGEGEDERARAQRERAREQAREARERQAEVLHRLKDLEARAEAAGREGRSEERERLLREVREIQRRVEATADERARADRDDRPVVPRRRPDLPGLPGGDNLPRPQPGRAEGLPPAPPVPPLPPGRPRAEQPPGPPREELRQEIERLRSEVRELRELLKRSLEERKERPERERKPEKERPEKERPEKERPEKERPQKEPRPGKEERAELEGELY
jgi:hypothetical protein